MDITGRLWQASTPLTGISAYDQTNSIYYTISYSGIGRKLVGLSVAENTITVCATIQNTVSSLQVIDMLGWYCFLDPVPSCNLLSAI